MSEVASEDPPDTIQSLRKKLDDAEKDFGQKRAQFRSMYLGCEAALQEEKQLRLKSVEQIEKLTKELNDLKSENQGVRAAAQLSDESRQEEITRMKSKYQEELASYQHIWKEAVNEAKASVAANYEEDRQQLMARMQQLEQQLSERSSKPDDKSEGLMSMMSQAIKRTTTSPQQATVQGKQKEAASLESNMKEEIGMLKGKLKDSQAKLKVYETKGKRNSATDETSDTNEVENFEELQDKIKEVQGYLDAERSSRTDLEMFVAVLNTQKGVLQEDADALRTELHNVCRLLEQERMAHRELKQTWRMANDEFLEQQTSLSVEIECMRAYLTHNQLEKLSKELRKKKSERTIPKKSQTPPSPKKDIRLTPRESSPRPNRLLPLASPIATSDQSLVLSSSSSSSDSDTENDTPVMLSSVSIEQGEEINEEMKLDSSKNAGIRKSASSSNIHSTKSENEGTDFTDRGLIAASKSRSQGDISASDLKDQSPNPSSPNDVEAAVEKHLHLNETGWSTMAESNSFHTSCMMCQNYEKQLQRLQKECIAYKDKDDTLQTSLREAKESAKSQDQENKALKSAVASSAEDAQGQIKAFQKHQLKHDQQLVDLQADFLALHREVIEQMDFVKERTPATSATNEDEEDNSEDDRKSLDDEAKLSAKEEELAGQIMFLKDRVMAEQFDKENMEKILQQDLDLARQEIDLLKEKLARAEDM